MKQATLLILFIGGMLLLLFTPLVSADSIDIYCQTYETGFDNCIKDIAVKRHDPKLCDRIESASSRGSCIGAFAKIMDDIELCKKIPKDARGADARNRCFLKFVKGPEEMYVCTEWIHDERYKDDCFSQILDKKRDDASFCGNFVSPKKRISCYLKVVKSLENEELCSLIQDEGKAQRTSQCRYCEEKGINYGEEYQNCRKTFFMNKIENLCDVHEKNNELKMVRGDKEELTFSGENPERDRFWITFHWAVMEGNYETYAATVKYSDGVRNEVFEGLRIGQSARGAQNDIGVQILNLWEELEGGGDERPEKVVYGTICVFRPSTREKEEPKKTAADEHSFKEDQEQRKQRLLKEIEEKRARKRAERDAERANESGDDEDTNASDTGEQGKKETAKKENEPAKNGRVKVREGGVFARLIALFKNIFS